MNYPCAKFGDFNFSRFGFIVQTDRYTQNHIHGLSLYSRNYSTVGMSNY